MEGANKKFHTEKATFATLTVAANFRSMISSYCSKHHVVIEKIVPLVEKGIHILELYKLRKDIMKFLGV